MAVVVLLLVAADLYLMAARAAVRIVGEETRPSMTYGHVPTPTTVRSRIVSYTAGGRSWEMRAPADGTLPSFVYYYRRWPRIAWFGNRAGGAVIALGFPVAGGIVVLLTKLVRRFAGRRRPGRRANR